MGSDSSEPIERWTAKRRAALVVSILKGDTTAAEAARKYGLSVGEIGDWRERFQQGAENALRARPKDEDAARILLPFELKPPISSGQIHGERGGDDIRQLRTH